MPGNLQPAAKFYLINRCGACICFEHAKKSTYFNRPIRYEPVESMTSTAGDNENGIASLSSLKCPAKDQERLPLAL
jgi:hypothetical protein